MGSGSSDGLIQAEPDGGPSFLRLWLPPFVLFAAVVLIWMAATPLDGSPDEAAHISRAAALVRGHWVGSPVPNANSKAYTDVVVPATFGSVNAGCFAFRPRNPAGCAPTPTANRSPRVVVTYVGHEPPTYYALVGLATFLPGGGGTIYWMRAFGALVDAAFLALAVATVRRWSGSRLSLVGVLLAVTPMALFQASVVSPSGIEIAAAIALWTAIGVWVTTYPADPPSGLLWVIGVSGVVLALVRPLSMLWFFLMLVAAVPLLLGRINLRQFFQRTIVRIAGVAIVIATVVNLVWLLVAHSLEVIHGGVPPPGTPFATLLGKSVILMHEYLLEGVGNFGWTDTPLPPVMIWLWWTAVVALAVYALVRSDMWGRSSLLLVAAMGFVFPVASLLAVAHSIGFAGQGRYYLPLWVGLPILSGCMLGGRQTDRRERLVAPSLVCGIGVFQIVAFGYTLRRYLVGTDGPVWPTSNVHDGWHPPLSGLALDLMAAALFVLWTAFFALSVRAGPARARQALMVQQPA